MELFTRQRLESIANSKLGYFDLKAEARHIYRSLTQNRTLPSSLEIIATNEQLIEFILKQQERTQS